MDTHGEEHTSFKSVVLRAIAVIGLVAILLLGAWGIIQIAFALPGFLNNLFSSNASPTVVLEQESLVLGVPATLTSGQPFALSWEHGNKKGDYSYQISYSCATGLSIHAPTQDGSYQSVSCDTSFNFIAATETMQMTPTLSSKVETPATFTVFATHLESGLVTAVGSTTTLVLPATATPPAAAPTPKPIVTPKPKPTTTYVPAARTSNLYGSPDLAISALSAQPMGSRYTMQFIVSNVGTNVSAAGWTLAAELPLNPVYTYTSVVQPGLYPGDKIIYTLTFDGPTYSGYDYGYQNYNYPQYGGRTVRITVDPQGYIAEYNRTNNTAAVQI